MTLDELETGARRRFPDDVRQVLTGAGWRPGRDVSALVSSWLRDVYTADPETEARLPLFPVARRLLAEFGGLAFPQLKHPGVGTSGYDVMFWPFAGRMLTDRFAEFGADLGVRMFPVAWYEDGSSDLAVADDGRVFLLHEAGEFLIGATPDEAMVNLVQGKAFPQVDEHGEVM